MHRLPHHASTTNEVSQYYSTRARQLWHEGFRWDGSLCFEDGAYQAHFTQDGERYRSFYIPPENRGKGLLRKLVTKSGPRVVTVTSCNIAEALTAVEADFKLAGRMLDTVEYRLIEEEYGDKRAQRSQALLMNHIDEGLAVMAAVGASERAMRAFCLHPLLQADVDLARNYDRVCCAMSVVDDGLQVLGLAMEYRSVANEYLSHCRMPKDGIRLSPLQDVNDMLIGDKVQNRKDFEKYHALTHERKERLAEYFHEWLMALGVASRYPELKSMLPSF